MCLQDVEIARATRTTRHDLTIGAAIQLLLGYNAKRFSLVIGNTSTGTVTFGGDSASLTGRGFLVSTTSPAIILRTVLDGDMVRSAWYGLGSAAGIRLTVWETEFAGLMNDQA